jgi:hypothetical protein
LIPFSTFALSMQISISDVDYSDKSAFPTVRPAEHGVIRIPVGIAERIPAWPGSNRVLPIPVCPWRNEPYPGLYRIY